MERVLLGVRMRMVTYEAVVVPLESAHCVAGRPGRMSDWG